MAGDAAALVLIPAYFMIFVVVVVQMIQAVRGYHKRMSFQMGFDVLVSVWAILRVAYWAVEHSRPLDEVPVEIVVSLTSFAPLFQFSAFSLLVLFFVKVSAHRTWSERGRTLFRPGWAVLNGALLAFTCIWVPFFSASVRRGDIAYRDWDNSWQTYFLAAYFASLVAGFVAVIPSLHRLDRGPRRSHPRHLARLAASLAAIFLSRSLYDVAFAARIGIGSRPLHTRPVLSVVGYASWEVLPTVLLLAATYSWRPRRGRTRKSASAAGAAASSLRSGSLGLGDRGSLSALSDRLLGDSISSLTSGAAFHDEELATGHEMLPTSARRAAPGKGKRSSTADDATADDDPGAAPARVGARSQPHAAVDPRGQGSWRGGGDPVFADLGRYDTDEEADEEAEGAGGEWAGGAAAADPRARGAGATGKGGKGAHVAGSTNNRSTASGSASSADPNSLRRSTRGSSAVGKEAGSRREIGVL